MSLPASASIGTSKSRTKRTAAINKELSVAKTVIERLDVSAIDAVDDQGQDYYFSEPEQQ